MPNIIQQMLAEDSEQIVEEMGYVDALTWGGTSYSCVLAPPDVESNLDDGGFMLTGDFQVKIRRALFNAGAGPFPDDGDRVDFDGAIYRVSAAVNKPGSAFFIFTIAKQ